MPRFCRDSGYVQGTPFFTQPLHGAGPSHLNLASAHVTHACEVLGRAAGATFCRLLLGGTGVSWRVTCLFSRSLQFRELPPSRQKEHD